MYVSAHTCTWYSSLLAVNVKLADYGISRFANPGGVKGEEGTPGYQAPEAIQQKGEGQAFDEKVIIYSPILCFNPHYVHIYFSWLQVDIFSFGMLLYELLTGQRPFESQGSNHEINRAICKGERPLLKDGNLQPMFPALVDLMEDCWRHAPAKRPAAHEVSWGHSACIGRFINLHPVLNDTVNI